MRILKSSLFLLVLVALCGKALAYGPPNYYPDGSHPRIFLTPSKLTELKAKAANNDVDWIALKASADAYKTYTVTAYSQSARVDRTIYYNYEGAGWRIALMTLGVAYQVSGNTSYAAKMKEVIDVITATGNIPMIVDSGYPSRNIAFAMAVAYDWLYNYLDTPTKTAMISTINNWFDWYKISAYKRTDTTATSNYFGGHLMGYGLCALATYGENARSTEISSYIRSLWDSSVVPAFSTGAFAGGYPVESYDYGGDQFIYLLDLARGIKTATGEDLFLDFPERIATSLLYNLKPNRWQGSVEGDMPGSFSGLMRKSLPLLLSNILDSTTGNQMQYYYNNLASTPYSTANTQREPYAYEKFLNSTSKTPENYKLTRPTYYRSLGDAHFYTRSDWTDNAIWTSFNGGVTHFASHQITGAGHIEIQRSTDNLLVTAGQWKGTDGINGSPKNFRLASVVANTLYYYDGGIYANTTNHILEGGQSFNGTTNILNYEVDTKYQYVKADLTGAYVHDVYPVVPSTLDYFYRNYIALSGGEVVLVYDRIRANSASYTKRLQWYLNPQGTTVLAGSLVTSTVGGSKLFLKTVYPADATTIISDNPASLFPSIPSIATIYGKRVEVSGPLSVNFNPLTVLITGSKTAAMPPTELVLSNDGKMIGAYIKDASKPTVALFSANKDGGDVVLKNGEIVSYTITAPMAKLQQILVHLSPNSYLTLLPETSANGQVTYEFKSGAFPDEGIVHKASSQGVIFVPSVPVPPSPPTGFKKTT